MCGSSHSSLIRRSINSRSTSRYRITRPKDFGAGAMVCGILGIVMCMAPILAVIPGAVEIVLGNIAGKQLPAGQMGMATAGFIRGIAAIALAVVFCIMFAALFIGLASASPDFLDLMDYYYSC